MLGLKFLKCVQHFPGVLLKTGDCVKICWRICPYLSYLACSMFSRLWWNVVLFIKSLRGFTQWFHCITPCLMDSSVTFEPIPEMDIFQFLLRCSMCKSNEIFFPARPRTFTVLFHFNWAATILGENGNTYSISGVNASVAQFFRWQALKIIIWQCLQQIMHSFRLLHRFRQWTPWGTIWSFFEEGHIYWCANQILWPNH